MTVEFWRDGVVHDILANRDAHGSEVRLGGQ
jgi:hypothetical protein